MIDSAFRDVLQKVREYLDRGVTVPAADDANESIAWSAEEASDGGVTLRAVVAGEVLEADFQKDGPAVAAFLIALAFWSERALGGVPVRCRLDVKRFDTQPSATALQHRMRSLFLLAEYAALLGSRIEVVTADRWEWEWPRVPTLNAASKPRAKAAKDVGGGVTGKSEQQLELEISNSRAMRDSFPTPYPPPSYISRKFPVGLFDGEVMKASAWTPGGASQVDLWGASKDGSVLHLFELKKQTPSPKLGILPEALFYARLLGYVRRARRVATPEIECQDEYWQGYVEARRAKHVVMWLIAPWDSYHPLLCSKGQSPLSWLNEGLAKEAIELRILPFDADDGGALRWRPDLAWPAIADAGGEP